MHKPQTFEIVPLSQHPEFAETCAAWDFSEWGCMENGITLDTTLKDYRTERAGTDLPATWVGTCKGRPAGMVRLRYDDHPDRSDLNPWMGSLFVHPLYRHQGLGRALCLTVMGAALKIFTFETLYLYTPDAQDFYGQLGWRTIGRVRDPRSIQAEGDSLMQIDLKG